MKTSPDNPYQFIKKFLLHALIAWLVFNIGDWLLHFYNVTFNLAFTVYKDGTPVSATDRFINNNLNQPLCFQILLLAYLAELNYEYVFRKKGFITFAVSCILWGLAGAGVSMLFTKHSIYVPFAAFFIETAVFIIAYEIVYGILFNFFYERYRRTKLKLNKSESELHLLRAQINPHFFFNTLNNLYGMALKENAGETAEAIELLAQMMRYNMEGNGADFVSLSKEINFIENYISLQRLRIPERENIGIDIEIKNGTDRAAIAPMLLIPLIENAWKYGISMEHTCYVILKISADEKQLRLFIENSIFPEKQTNGGSGMGISNVRQRLELIYPGKYQLSIDDNKKRYQVNLTIDL